VNESTDGDTYPTAIPVTRRTVQSDGVMRSLRRVGRRAPLAGLGLVSLVVLLLPATVLGADWSSAQRISSTGGSRLDSLHQLAAGDGAFHVVHPRVDAVGIRDRLVYQRSRDGGASWGRERALFTGNAEYPNVIPNLAIDARGPVVAVAWRSKGPKGTSLWVRTSKNRGFTFGPRVEVASSGPGLGVPAVTVGDGAIVVGWTSRRKGVVKVARSTNGGKTFKKTIEIASTKLSIDCRTNVPDGLVGLTSSGSRIHVAWSHAGTRKCQAGMIKMRTSQDQGKSWGRQRTVTKKRSYGWPELDARGTTVIATVQLPNGALLVARSSKAGRDWGERLIKPAKDHLLSAGDVTLLPNKKAQVTYVDERIKGNRLVATRVMTRHSNSDARRFGSAEVVMKQAARLRLAPNVADTRDQLAIVLQSGGFDGSPRNIYAVRQK
jgi:hypothetical protein